GTSMARGWHGDSAGHARAGQLGGRKSAETRKQTRTTNFGEQLQAPNNQKTQRKSNDAKG
ncbi:MAG TPA: hypothetical protein VF272_01275, partial [Candidatus Saccharimonadia bacterium]